MTFDDLMALCKQACQIQSNSPHPEEPFVRLVLIKKRLPTGRSVHLLEGKGPRGRLDIVREKDGQFECVTLFYVKDIVRWVERNA